MNNYQEFIQRKSQIGQNAGFEPLWMPDWLYPKNSRPVGCVYIAQNMTTKQVYVGRTKGSLSKRKAWHLSTAKRGDGYYFHNAIRSYGSSNFVWCVVFRSTDVNVLNEAERFLIQFYNTMRPSGYNLTRGGDGIDLPPEIRERVAEFHRGRKRSPETRRRISEACMGIKRRLGAVLSRETKRKISLSNTGKKHTEEQKRKIGDGQRGKQKSIEQRAKMSEARKAWWKRRRCEQSEASLFNEVTEPDAELMEIDK